MAFGHNCTRRAFLQNAGLNVPTLTLLLGAAARPAWSTDGSWEQFDSAKFSPIELSPYFTASPRDFGHREQAKRMGVGSPRDGLVHTPSGKQSFRGVPFLLGPGGLQNSWIVLSTRKHSWLTDSVEVSLGQKAGSICLAEFCDWDANETPPAGQDVQERVGQRLAEVTLYFANGNQAVLPIRRRYEVNAPSVEWGHLSFLSFAQTADAARELTDPLRDAKGWGNLQMGIKDNSYLSPSVWISALANPHPDQIIKTLRFHATSEDLLVVCGLTLFHGKANPLRYERLTTYQITLPESADDAPDRWKVEVDLGVIARMWYPTRFEPEAWLAAPDAGLGARAQKAPSNRHVYVDLTASAGATLWLVDAKSDTKYAFDLSGAEAGEELQPRSSGPPGTRVEIPERGKVWLHGKVVDHATQRPTPVRLAFRSSQGRYIPPYGHRSDINDGWFQDYGADVKLMDTPFAYVDGTFQVELPVGDVYLEMTKGFEYAPVRRKLHIQPSQRELKLEVTRIADLRSEGWVSADTHVHFLSPTTALLEAAAEGLNLVNLLAAQWGDLFSNVGDITNEPLLSRDEETMVWVGSENRQHILGHIGMLGPNAPVFPMSAGGVDESYLGDPLWNSMADWADACRERGGLAVAAHFPYPTGEIAADVALGKIDAVELWPQRPTAALPGHFNFLRFLDWYRYLSCGYRLPAVGGTDKMGAYMAVGTNRAYAYIGQDEFTFPNWAKAVRSGNTFVTSGPLLNFLADGCSPGQEINLGTGGGTIDVHASAKSFVPFHRLEIVLNGQVVASREAEAGTRELAMTEKVPVPGPGWIAARCSSELGPVTTWEFMVQAHTSPVYLVSPGHELFSPQTAAYMLALIDGSQAFIENLAVRPDAERLARVRKVFEDARDQLHRRLHAHGLPH